MKRSHIVFGLIIFFVLGVALIMTVKDESRSKVMGNVMGSIPEIDKIIVKDAVTDDELLTLTTTDQSFSKMADVYHFYHNLKWTEKKLLKDVPVYEVDYLKNNEIQFTIGIYQVPDQYMSSLPNDVEAAQTYPFSYSANNKTYIFAFEEINQLIGVGDGLEKLMAQLHAE